jgi:hypothetical protein
MSKPTAVKKLSYIACLVFCTQAAAQRTELYSDYNWKPCEPLEARFYSTIQKTDSGWLRNDYFISELKPQEGTVPAPGSSSYLNTIQL